MHKVMHKIFVDKIKKFDIFPHFPQFFNHNVEKAFPHSCGKCGLSIKIESFI